MSSVKKSKKITEDVQAETGDMNKYPRHQESKEFMVTMLNAEGTSDNIRAKKHLVDVI